MLDATAQILAQQGYAVISTNLVAEKAGVSIGSLYEYFPHKKSLIATTLSREIDRLTEDVLADLRIAMRSDGAPAEVIHQLVCSLTEALEVRRDVLRAAFHQVPYFWDIPKARRHTRRLLRIVRHVQRRGAFTATTDDHNEKAWVLVSMIWYALVQNAIHRPPQLDRDKVINNIAETLLQLL